MTDDENKRRLNYYHFVPVYTLMPSKIARNYGTYNSKMSVKNTLTCSQ